MIKGIATSLALAIIGSAASPLATEAFATPAGVNAAYSEAQKAYSAARNYPEAARLFYLVLTQSEGDVKAKSEFGLAESLKAMGLTYSASYFYMRIAIQGSQNPFFRLALENLAAINTKTPLGRGNLAGLFDPKARIDPIQVPSAARGFYFFYKGLDAFEHERVADAKAEFSRVPEGPYYPRAQYYLGVMSALSKDTDGAVRAFRMALRTAPSDTYKQLSTLALARIHYERKEIRQAFEYYSQIPRDSDLWLESLFEGAWAFFLIQKPNNTLGNTHTIHSPFFRHRFFPESYILNAITYLKLCYYQKVDDTLAAFQQRYRPTFQDLGQLLKKYQNQPEAFFGVISQYRKGGGLREFPGAAEVVDSVSRADAFKEAMQVVNNLNREERTIARQYEQKWGNTGLLDVLRQAFDQRKRVTVRRSGEDLYSQAVQAWKYLKDLSDQTYLITLERRTGQTDQLRAKFNSEPIKDNNEWGEGMKPLNLNEELEYWPFEGEYWEDELGGYVYNIGSNCGAEAGSKSAPKK